MIFRMKKTQAFVTEEEFLPGFLTDCWDRPEIAGLDIYRESSDELHSINEMIFATVQPIFLQQ